VLPLHPRSPGGTSLDVVVVNIVSPAFSRRCPKLPSTWTNALVTSSVLSRHLALISVLSRNLRGTRAV
jgi:hypothetical protein